MICDYVVSSLFNNQFILFNERWAILGKPMRRTIVLLIAIILLPVSVACSGRVAVSPTPFPTAGPSPTPGSNGPITLTVTELMSAPGLYRDSVIQVTGLLRKQPLIVCETKPNLSPAGWGLAEEGVLAPAGGFEQQVRSLLPDNLTMTVEGRWRQWSGLVGCGKSATQQEVWFLEAGRILSPSPLTQVTLTPSSGVAIAEITDTPENSLSQPEPGGEFPTPALENTPVDPFSTPEPAASIGPTFDPIAPAPTGTLPGTLLITPTFEGTLAAIATSGTPSISATPTAPATGLAGTPQPTVTGTLPTPTRGTSSGMIVDKGDFFIESFGDFAISSLAGGTIDSWVLDLFEGDSFNIYAVAPSPADIILSVLKDGQPIVNRQNSAPAGSPEIINSAPITADGLYEIQVLTVNSQSTDYVLVLSTDPETPVSIPGLIISGTPRSAVQLPEFGYHYWVFVADAGDQISITLTPLAGEDPAIYLYDSTGEELVGADYGVEGEPEEIEETAAVSGLYVISIEEIYSEPMRYDLVLTIE